MNLYQELSGNYTDEFYENHYKELTINLTSLLKDLLGYEQKNRNIFGILLFSLVFPNIRRRKREQFLWMKR